MNLNTYLNETKAELRHVSWPSRSQAIAYTATVILLSILTAALLGAFDAVFNSLLGLVF